MSRQRQTERNREPHGTYGRSWVSHLLPQRSHLVLASRRPDRVQGRPPGHSGGAGGGGSARGLHRRWRGRRRIRARLPTPKRCHAGSNFAKGMTWTKDQRDDMPTPKRCHAGTVDCGGMHHPVSKVGFLGHHSAGGNSSVASRTEGSDHAPPRRRAARTPAGARPSTRSQSWCRS